MLKRESILVLCSAGFSLSESSMKSAGIVVSITREDEVLDCPFNIFSVEVDGHQTPQTWQQIQFSS